MNPSLKKMLNLLKKNVMYLEHPIIRIIIILILVVYISGIFNFVNIEVSRILSQDIIRLLSIIVIVIVGMKDPLLSLLLGLALVISLKTNEHLNEDPVQKITQEHKQESEQEPIHELEPVQEPVKQYEEPVQKTNYTGTEEANTYGNFN
jgi:hypothetical protein